MKTETVTRVHSNGKTFHRGVLELDCAAAAEQIQTFLRTQLSTTLHRRGAVVAVSGGVDSAVCVALAVGAFGPERVVGLLLPERDSGAGDTERGRMLCQQFGIECHAEDITPALEVLGCYQRRDDAIRTMFPQFGPGYRSKIAVAEGLLEHNRVTYFNLVIAAPDGVEHRQRMPLPVYLAVVAATNMKQRVRKLIEYYHAESRNYAVIGTPNRLEYDLGFFVRGGDGLADVKPIAHLYKAEVYALARHMGVPAAICKLTPSTGTYSLPQTQSEFFFGLPWDQMDLLLYAYRHAVAPDSAARELGLSPEQVERVYADLAAKYRNARQLHQSALVLEPAE